MCCFSCRAARVYTLLADSRVPCPMTAFELNHALLDTGLKQAQEVYPGRGPEGDKFGVGSMEGSASGPSTPILVACNMPTSSPPQASRTAVQTRPTKMFLGPLGMLSHLHLIAFELDVSCLSCTPPKWARVPVSFLVITLHRLHCFAPAQFLRVPHHPGCHEKS